MIQRGEDVMLGVGIEAVRGTGVAPQAWIPARTPAGIAPVIDKVNIRETRGSKFASHSAEPVMVRAEGDLEFNVRSNSIGYFLLSLLGGVSSVPVSGQSGAVDHTFSVLPNNPEHPSLSLTLNQPAAQSYRYLLALASVLGIEVAPDDLVKGNCSFIASRELAVVHAANTNPLVGDFYFRHQDVSIRFAANMAGLGVATPTIVKSLSVEIPNGARVDQNVSQLNPGNVIATTIEPKISVELDYLTETFHNAFANGYFAAQITMERVDVIIGASTHPRLTLTFPRVSISNWSPERPIDDIVKESVGFTVHFSEIEGFGVRPVLRNTITAYQA